MTFKLAMLASGAPADDLAAGAERVEVCERIGEPATYRLRYQLTEEDGDFPLLADGRIAPGGELTIGTQVGDTPSVLVSGQVHGQKLHFMHGVRESWVEVCGGDKAFEMDREIKAKAWSQVTVSDVVTTILSSYGLTPKVDPIKTKFTEDTHTLMQRDTDLRFVRRLARRYGYWFYVDTDALGLTTGYFKRPMLTGPQAATLTINRKHPHLAAITIEWDVERPSAAAPQQLNLVDLSTLDGAVTRSPLALLGGQGLGTVAAPRQAMFSAPVDDAGDLVTRAEATVIEGGWFIRAKGSVTARALGAVLRAHTVIAIDGLGKRHSGGYVVAAVRHVLDGDGHTMEFELIRNAWEA